MSEDIDRPTATAASGERPGPAEPTPPAEPAEGNSPEPTEAEPAEQASAPDAQRSPALIATAVALPVTLIVAVLLIAALTKNTSADNRPLALGPVPAPGATGPDCANLLPALAPSLGDGYTKAPLAQPIPPATAAWRKSGGGDPVVLRCGLERPQEFTKASPLQVVDGVNWFEVRDRDNGGSSGTWYAVDRGSYIAVTLPAGTGPTPLQTISDAIGKALPAKPLDPGPVPN